MRSFRLPLSLIFAALVATLLLGTVSRTARAEDSAWQTDFKAALEKAKAEKKYVLVDFTGSDWCGWCIRLHKEVFDKEPFKSEAAKQYVLVELDFPHEKELSKELKKQNTELSEKYKVQGFPTVLLMDGEGKVIARTGYRPGGPEDYLKQLAEFPKIFENVAAAKGKLDAVKGLDRAKLLDTIIEGYSKLGNDSEEQSKEVGDWSKEIIALDVDNKAGLKVKYEFPLKIAEAKKLAQSGEAAEAKDLLDKALSLQGVPAELRQEGYLAKAQICETEGKFAAVVTALKEAKEAAPESQMAKNIDQLISRFTKLAEEEQAVAKLEAELPKAEGIDRAKLLDKLITAKQKLPPNRTGAENVKKWTKEIIDLDPDNKAGLKKKYQVQGALADALDLARAGKTDEAAAALDKVLALPEIGGEDKQKALFFKAQIALQHRDMTEALGSMKKALDAAPESQMAPMIKQMISQLEKMSKSTKKTDKSEE
jgi:thioredoxin-related protein